MKRCLSKLFFRLALFRVLTVLALLLLHPARAVACASCDTISAFHPHGWSPTGLSILVWYETNAGLQRSVRLEVHNVDGNGAAACHDLLGEPEKRIDCSKVVSSPDRPPARSSQESVYNIPLQSVDPLRVHATFDKRMGGQSTRIEIRIAGFPDRLGEVSVSLNERVPEFDAQNSELYEAQLAVLPTPDRKKAAVFLRGVNTNPNGHRGWALKWVNLPAGFDAPLVEGTQFARAIPRFGTESTPRDQAQAVAANSAGLGYHRQGQFKQSADRFTAAVVANPDHVLARYNLACAFARLNQPDRAMLVLQELLNQAPVNVAVERRARAALDADLVPLRERADFQDLVCGGIPCAPVADLVGSALPTADQGGSVLPTADQPLAKPPQPAATRELQAATPSSLAAEIAASQAVDECPPAPARTSNAGLCSIAFRCSTARAPWLALTLLFGCIGLRRFRWRAPS